MGERIKVVDVSIKYKGIFQLEWLYKLIHEWLIDNDYVDTEGGDKCFENLYLEKVNDLGREVWIEWKSENIPHGSKYYKKHIEVKHHVLGLKKVEEMHKGKKLKLHFGEDEVWFRGYLEVDVKDRFSKHPILKHIHKFFVERILKKQLEWRERDLYRDVYRLQGTVKQFLHMKRWAQAADYFRPPGW